MSVLTPKSWFAIGTLSVLAIAGSVAAATQYWLIATTAAFAILLLCGILLVLQVPRSLKINRILVNRLDQLRQLQRQTLGEATKPLPKPSPVPRELINLHRKDIPQLHKRVEHAERRLLSVGENAAYAADKNAQELAVSLHQIEHQLENANIEKTLSSLEALRTSTDTTAQKISQLGDPTQQLTKIIWEDTQQLQAYMQLLSRISPRWAMPPLGRWALEAKSMLHLVLLIKEHEPKTVVELGSGSSTVWLSYFVEQYGGQVHSVDHLAQYQQQTLQYLKKHDLETTASVTEAPLQSYTIGGHEYSWYDMQAFEQIESIDLLIIDGPPGKTNRWARYPALPLLQHKLAPNALVVLDDSDRKDETQTLQQWLQDNPSVQQKDQGISRLSVLYGFDKH